MCIQTIENTREKDETLVNPDDEEVLADEADDEFAGQCKASWLQDFMTCSIIWLSQDSAVLHSADGDN